MQINQLWLNNFRNYEALELSFPARGLTVIGGPNGQGKTNVLEAITYVANQRSFRVAHLDALIKNNSDQAIVRADAVRNARNLLIECEINSTGRNRTMVNKQNLRSSDVESRLMVTVFAPDDLDLIKGGPSGRRVYLDQLLLDVDSRQHALQRDVERIIRQRNTLLRQAGGRATADVVATLDVWDAKFSEVGERLGQARRELLDKLRPRVNAAYKRIVDSQHGEQTIDLEIQDDWSVEGGGSGLAQSLSDARKADLARSVTTVGPHRDELALRINNRVARTHASQGEQRSLALALRFAGHELLTEINEAPPLLLLDDVLSELDARRSSLLLEELPAGQVFLTTAGAVPEETEVQRLVSIYNAEVIQ